jgi:hypothetical protein
MLSPDYFRSVAAAATATTATTATNALAESVANVASVAVATEAHPENERETLQAVGRWRSGFKSLWLEQVATLTAGRMQRGRARREAYFIIILAFDAWACGAMDWPLANRIAAIVADGRQ